MLALLVLAACSGASDDTGADDTGAPAAVDGRPLSDAAAAYVGGPSDAVGSAVAFVPRDGAPAAVAVSAALASEVCVLEAGAGESALDAAPTCWRADRASAFAGYSLAGGADLDGDGVGDLLVGAVGDDAAGSGAGAAYRLAVPTAGGARSLAEATTVLLGENGADLAGSGVAFAGDVDGDGAQDILVGASGNDARGSGGGRAYLLRGPVPAGTVALADIATRISGEGDAAATPAPPHGAPLVGDGLGVVLDGVGDLDGDGLADIALGANGSDRAGLDAGALAIFHGPVPEGDLGLDDADALYLGAATRDFAGDAVAAGGDLDGDGLPDVLVGGRTDGPGTTWIVPGPCAPGTHAIDDVSTTLVGEAVGDFAGAAAARGGDLDGDGHGDVVVGAYGNDDGALDGGAVYLVRGPLPAGVYALGDAERWDGEAASDNAGRAVAGGADADGDGLDDVLVGAPASADGGPSSGKAWLVLSE